MALFRKDLKRRLSASLKLDVRLGQTMTDSPREGYIENQWGSFDDAATSKKLIAALRSLVSDTPDEPYFLFLLAGSLARARHFDDSIQAYRALSVGTSSYAEPSMLILPTVLWCAGDKITAQKALDEYNAPFISKGIEPRHTRVEDMFYPSPPC